jgi:hypothetical protein
MLLGGELHIHTDHKNILNDGDSSERRLRWISYADEYSPTLHYVEGPLNVIADTFSRLSRLDDTSALVGKKAITGNSDSISYSIYDDNKIFNCLVHLQCLLISRGENLSSRRENDMINVISIFLKISWKTTLERKKISKKNKLRITNFNNQ